MIVVTGGAGFIGSRIIKSLNKKGFNQIIVVDNLERGEKIKNLSGLDIYDYFESAEFIEIFNKKNSFKKIQTIFHEGACSTTTEWNGKYIMEKNFKFSKDLFDNCQSKKIKLIYASSASVYGSKNKDFTEKFTNEKPLNPYAFSKFLFDQYFRMNFKKIKSQVTGLRYFNVYGPGEAHKESMTSPVFKFYNQLLKKNKISIFKGSHNYSDGEHQRDFIYVDDCVDVNLWFNKKNISGIFNVGTGKASSFNSLAKEVIKYFHKGKVKYIDFPENLINSYQPFTKANVNKIKKAGYKKKFITIESGIKKYLDFLSIDKNT